MFVTVKMVSELGKPDEFVYTAYLDEQNEDTGDFVWSDLSDQMVMVEMIDRGTEQVRCLFPDHKILGTSFSW